jgi:replication factor C subunit 2/4
VIEALIFAAQGDLRRAITYLQSASRLKQSDAPQSAITATDVQEIAGVVPDHVINGFASTLGIEISASDMDVDDSDKKVAKGFDSIRKKVRGLMREGYSAAQLLSQVYIRGLVEYCSADIHISLQIHDLIVAHPTLSSRQKSHCALVIAEADKALCDGADEELWILEVGLKVHKAVSS